MQQADENIVFLSNAEMFFQYVVKFVMLIVINKNIFAIHAEIFFCNLCNRGTGPKKIST